MVCFCRWCQCAFCLRITTTAAAGQDCITVHLRQLLPELALAFLQALLGAVDVWICNAGYSGSFKPFLDSEPSTLEAVVRTNLLGTLLCAREAGRLMLQQQLGGHIFIMDGAGADGSATPQYAAYGEASGLADLDRACLSSLLLHSVLG
jgi:NAD(P)-dependent dehydrogenase (short-subunit alcohol dehydrogenase family)